MEAQNKKNTGPNDHGINYYLKDNESSDLSNIPGTIIRTHYYTSAGAVQTMTSREIAELTGKRHSDVMEAIRNMEPAWIKVGQRNFPLTYYIDQWNRQQPQYELSKKECLYIATKFNDEARAILILRWEQLETTYQKSEQLAIAYKRISELEANAEANKLKVQFAESIEGSTDTVDVETFSKVLFDQQGIRIGRNSLMKWFRDHRFLMKNNVPFQWVIARKLMKVKEGTFYKSGQQNPSTYIQSRITGKGQVYFTAKLLEGFNLSAND